MDEDTVLSGGTREGMGGAGQLHALRRRVLPKRTGRRLDTGDLRSLGEEGQTKLLRLQGAASARLSFGPPGFYSAREARRRVSGFFSEPSRGTMRSWLLEAEQARGRFFRGRP